MILTHEHPCFVPPAATRSPAILIVDDAPANIGVLRTMMVQQGYQTFVATSGERAMSIAQRVQPDLILLDVVMPGIDGFETCRKLKEHPATQHIPVIFMSAKSDTDDIVAGFDLGAADYIGKPLRMAEVCARVRAQLQMRSSSDAQKEQAERLRLIVNSMDEGLMIVEAGGRIQYSNPACERYLGYGPNELAGHALPDLLGAALAQDYLDYFAACATDPAAGHQAGAREVLIRHSDGALRAMDLTLTPMNAGEPLFIGLLHDITHHKQSETALQQAAMVDQLTQIANRRRFDNFLEKEWHRALRSGQPLSLIVLDVDHFKLYNDTLGHAAGDLRCKAWPARCSRARCAPPTWRRATAAKNSCCCSPRPRSTPPSRWPSRSARWSKRCTCRIPVRRPARGSPPASALPPSCRRSSTASSSSSSPPTA